MAKQVEEIIGKEDTKNLRSELNDLLSSGCSYGDIEEAMLGHGLEMDYFLDMI